MWEFLLGATVTAIGTKSVEYFCDWLKRRKSATARMEILRADDVAAWGWSGERLLKELIALDHRLLGDLLNEDREGTVKQWAPVFMSHPEGWALLARANKQIAGYFSFFALTEEAFEKARQGTLLDREVTMESTVPMDVPGTYSAYFVLLGALPDYPRAGAKLLEAFFDQLQALGERGVVFEEIIANAFTPHGKRICEGFGMTKIRNHDDFGIVYSLRLSPWPTCLSFKRWDSLKFTYSEHLAISR